MTTKKHDAAETAAVVAAEADLVAVIAMLEDLAVVTAQGALTLNAGSVVEQVRVTVAKALARLRPEPAPAQAAPPPVDD